MAKKILAGQTHEQPITVKEVSSPSTPASGYAALYAKTDSRLYTKDDAGTEKKLGDADIVQTGTGTGRTIHVQLSGESAPSGLVKGDIVIAEV